MGSALGIEQTELIDSAAAASGPGRRGWADRGSRFGRGEAAFAAHDLREQMLHDPHAATGEDDWQAFGAVRLDPTAGQLVREAAPDTQNVRSLLHRHQIGLIIQERRHTTALALLTDQQQGRIRSALPEINHQDERYTSTLDQIA